MPPRGWWRWRTRRRRPCRSAAAVPAGSGKPVGIWNVSTSSRPSVSGDDDSTVPRMANEPGRPTAGTLTTPEVGAGDARVDLDVHAPDVAPTGVGAALARIHLETQLGRRTGHRGTAHQAAVGVPSERGDVRVGRAGRHVVRATATGAVVDRVEPDTPAQRASRRSSCTRRRTPGRQLRRRVRMRRARRRRGQR